VVVPLTKTPLSITPPCQTVPGVTAQVDPPVFVAGISHGLVALIVELRKPAPTTSQPVAGPTPFFQGDPLGQIDDVKK
jgi:hypothetical protein